MGAFTNEVQIAGRNRWYRGWVNIESTEDVSDTVTKVRVRATLADKYAALYGVHYDVVVNGETLASRDVVLNNYGGWADRSEVYVTYEAPRGAEKWNCPAKIHCYGKTVSGYGSAGGDTWATVYATVPQRGYSEPNPPKSCTLTKASDTCHKLAWEGDYTGMDGARPWAGVYVDRRTDDGAWVCIKDVSWDVTNYSDNSTVAGHKYDYRLCAHGPGGNSNHVTVGTSYTTPAAPSRVEASKSGASAVALRVYGVWAYAKSWGVQRSADGGSTWKDVAVAAATASSYVELSDTSAPAGTVTYRVRAVRDSLASAWVQSGSITTITPPRAPAVTATAVVATGDAVRVSWAPNHPDGSAQAAAQVEVSGAAAETHDVGAGTWLELKLAKGAWKVRVRTKGLHADWGEWSAYAAVTVADRPQCWVSSPPHDGAIVSSMPLAVSVEASDETGVASATLTLTGPTGTTVASLDVTSLADVELGSYATVANGLSYTLTLSVRGGSSLTATATRTFRTFWAEPATPVIAVTYDDELAAHVAVRNGVSAYSVDETTLVGPMSATEDGEGLLMLGTIEVEGGTLTLGSAAMCETFTVERVLDEGDTTITAGMLDSQEAVDRVPPLNVDFTYRVTGLAESGETSQATAVANVPATGQALNFGVDASEVVVLDLTGDYSQSSERASERYHFAGGGADGHLPVSYPLDEVNETTSVSFSLDQPTREKFRKARRKHWIGWWRGHFGERAYGPMKLSETVKAPGVFTGSAEVAHDVFEEPANG